MVDTVKLTLSSGMFTILDISLFQKDTMNAARGYFVLVQNPSKGELGRGVYKPRLTLTKRINTSGRFEPTLSIELSIPKLLFGNNFDELRDNDFPQVIERLKIKLKEMGVLIFTNILEKAPVSTIHYSKNIPLTDGSIPYQYINKIKEANVNLAIDINQTDYRNDGCSYKWHTNSYEIAFYDKLKDLLSARVSNKRSLENDNEIQLNLFESVAERRLFEVLRMEVRLNSRQKIKKLLINLGITEEIIFENLFKGNVSKRILLFYLEEIERKRPRILDYQSSSVKDLVADIRINNPNLTIRRVLMLCGLKQVTGLMNLRELRTMFNNNNYRGWYRLMAEAQKVELPKNRDYFSPIRLNLEAFEPLRLVDYPDLMINNDKYR